MTRWIGSGGEVKSTGVKDLTGTSRNERGKTKTENLDDMIHYLEYAKYSGGQAARVDVEQEEYWAMLLRHILVEEIIQRGHLIRNNENVIIGMTFSCNKCNHYSKIEKISEKYSITFRCEHIKEREDDIEEYLVYLIEKYNKNKE